jgi:hypothetical protein
MVKETFIRGNPAFSIISLIIKTICVLMLLQRKLNDSIQLLSIG